MPTPKIILVDLDNVVANQMAGFLRIFEIEYPEIYRHTPNEILNFDIEQCYPEEYRETILSLRRREGFFRELPLVEGAKEMLEQLLSRGHDVRIVTAPIWDYQHCVREKYIWVEEKLSRDYVGRMIMTRDKTLIHGDYLLDDKPTVEGCTKPTWEHILFDQPYNRAVPDKRRVTWKNIVAELGL